MGDRPNAVHAWGFEVKNDYENEDLEALFELAEEQGHEIEGEHCKFESHEEQGPSFVYVKESYRHTDWDDLKILEPTILEAFVAWKVQLQAFCEEHKIPWQEPSWFLAAYM
jgi:hypothetical protein